MQLKTRAREAASKRAHKTALCAPPPPPQRAENTGPRAIPCQPADRAAGYPQETERELATQHWDRRNCPKNESWRPAGDGRIASGIPALAGEDCLSSGHFSDSLRR